jgi:hypothetical protein
VAREGFTHAACARAKDPTDLCLRHVRVRGLHRADHRCKVRREREVAPWGEGYAGGEPAAHEVVNDPKDTPAMPAHAGVSVLHEFVRDRAKLSARSTYV